MENWQNQVKPAGLLWVPAPLCTSHIPLPPKSSQALPLVPTTTSSLLLTPISNTSLGLTLFSGQPGLEMNVPFSSLSSLQPQDCPAPALAPALVRKLLNQEAATTASGSHIALSVKRKSGSLLSIIKEIVLVEGISLSLWGSRKDSWKSRFLRGITPK